MLNIICTITLMVNMGGFYVQSFPEQVKGKILNESTENYLVDFTNGIHSDWKVDKNAYKEVIVPKNKCIKL